MNKVTNAKNISVFIIDDEPLARKRIEQLLKEFDFVIIKRSLDDPVVAFEKVNEEQPDLLFLDIQMPELNGFQFIEKLARPWPLIIFTTAYDEYALEAFRVNAVDYLLKPIDEEQFWEALHRVRELRERKEKEEFHQRIESLLSHVDEQKSGKSYRSRIPIKRSDKIYFIKDDDILWVQASGKYVELKHDDKKHLLRSLLSEFGETLNPEKFIRIHRSVIINIDQIKQINPWFRGEYQVEMKDSETFTTGKSYRNELKRLID